MGIPIDNLAAEVQKELGAYSEEINAKIKKRVDIVADEAVKTLKDTSPKRTGKYARGWSKSTGYESQRTKRNTVHNKGNYQLTHLLENGHAKRGGGRVAPRVHIEPVEKKAIESLEAGIKEDVEA